MLSLPYAEPIQLRFIPSYGSTKISLTNIHPIFLNALCRMKVVENCDDVVSTSNTYIAGSDLQNISPDSIYINYHRNTITYAPHTWFSSDVYFTFSWNPVTICCSTYTSCDIMFEPKYLHVVIDLLDSTRVQNLQSWPTMSIEKAKELIMNIDYR